MVIFQCTTKIIIRVILRKHVLASEFLDILKDMLSSNGEVVINKVRMLLYILKGF